MNIDSPNIATIKSIVALSVILLACITPAQAVDWINTSNINAYYDLGINWAGGSPPTSTQSAFFGAGSSYEVWWDSFTGNTTTSSLIAIAGEVTLRENAGFGPYTHTVTGNTTLEGGSITIGGFVEPLNLSVGNELKVDDGSQFRVEWGSEVDTLKLKIARVGGAASGATVDGFNSQLTVTGLTEVGLSNTTGTLTFENHSTGNSLADVNLAVNNSANSTGNMNVLSGAAVATGNIAAATSGKSGQSSTIAVDGVNSTLTQSGSSTLTLGAASASTGSIDVKNGGTYNTGTGLNLINSTGTINVGTVGDGTFNANGTINLNGGTINLAGGTLNATTIDHTNGGTFDFTGGTLTVDNFQGTLVQNGGDLEIGASPGITDVTNTYDLQSGALEIEFFNGGLSPVAGVDFDRLTANQVQLAGTLDLVTDAGYTPTVGDTFEIISAGSSVTGMFDTINGQYLGGGLCFAVDYNATDVTVEVVGALPGDFDLDNDVDGEDFLIWQRGDTPNSAADYLDWEMNFGTVVTSMAAAVVVPEPTGLVLGMMGLLFVGVGRGRHR